MFSLKRRREDRPPKRVRSRDRPPLWLSLVVVALAVAAALVTDPPPLRWATGEQKTTATETTAATTLKQDLWCERLQELGTLLTLLETRVEYELSIVESQLAAVGGQLAALQGGQAVLATHYIAAPETVPAPAPFVMISPGLFSDLRADAARVDAAEPATIAAAPPALGAVAVLGSWRGLVDVSLQICALAFAAVVMLVPAGCASVSRRLCSEPTT